MKQCTCYALRAVDCTCMPAKYEEIYEIYTTPDQEPVAWRTFDGEGLYFYCSYEDNETYADVWNKRNPNHKGWVEPLYTTPQQRTWVGLSVFEINELVENTEFDDYHGLVETVEAKLKDKNT